MIESDSILPRFCCLSPENMGLSQKLGLEQVLVHPICFIEIAIWRVPKMGQSPIPPN
jgi:hypothetical protein